MCHGNEKGCKNWRGTDYVSSKLTWGIWRILTQALENLKNLLFNGLLLTKVHVWGKKSIEELCLMTLNIDAKFEGKMTCAFKNDMSNVANFHQSMFGTLKIELWRGPFIQRGECMGLKFTGKFCVMTKKNVAKFEEELTCQFKIDMRNLTNLTNFGLSTQKSQKFAL